MTQSYADHVRTIMNLAHVTLFDWIKHFWMFAIQIFGKLKKKIIFRDIFVENQSQF